MKLAYLGTPHMAVAPLQALCAAGFDVVHVVTRPDKRRGRGAATTPSPVKLAATELGIPVSHAVDDLLAIGVELAIVVAFGQLIKPHVLQAFPMINAHFSLLPRWRGAAPVERALLAGDTETGVCIMRVDEQLDTGDVYARRVVPIGPTTTAVDLRQELVKVASQMLVHTVTVGLSQPQPQTGQATYAQKMTSADLRIDWAADPQYIDRQVRVGGAWTTFRDKRVKVCSAQLVSSQRSGQIDGDIVGGVRLLMVQPEGKAAMPWSAFVNGNRPTPGEMFV